MVVSVMFSGRNITVDNYNLGLQYQCVEFAKRYYYEHLGHKMPDAYGHARDFFDKNLEDGDFNAKRGLIQYSNPSQTKPQPDDLIVYSGTLSNKFGHVSIVSNVGEQDIEVIQQNPGPFGASRVHFPLHFEHNRWKIANERILGWLRIRKKI